MEAKEDEFDLSIFDREHKEDDEYIFIERLSIALKYYSHLDVINNEEDRNKFNILIQKYDKLIDDFTILIKKSKQQLYEIQQSLFKNSIFQICDITKCDFTTRHSNQNEMQNINNGLDPILDFYKLTMDSLHFYIFHLFDCGLRTINIGNDIDENDEIKQDKKEYFDAAFARVTKMINDRKYITKSFQRFKNNNKFSMVVHKIDANNTGICIFTL